MKKIITVATAGIGKMQAQGLTVGVDLGDRSSCYCVLNEQGEIVQEEKVATTPKAMRERFAEVPRCRMALETGTHSPWVSRLLSELGHEVIVAHAQRVELIAKSRRKNDRMDARTLARLARIDPQLLSPIQHRSAEAQAHLTVIRARASLVRARTSLINTIRGVTKSTGERLRGCNPRKVGERAQELSPELQHALGPVLSEIDSLSDRIREYDERIRSIAESSYPKVELLKQVHGVGTLVALTFMLTLEDPHRFSKSRDAGCYAGLQPGKRDSGDSEPQLHISKEGNKYLRAMLVQSAQHILGPFGADSDLRRWGLRLSERGGKNAKKRAIVAVARKLAVLLHHLWVSGEVYEPLRNNSRMAAAAAA